MRIGIGHADVVRVGIVRTAAVRASVARTTVVCVCVERLLARVQLGEPRLGGLCLGRRAPASGHRPVRSPREWRRQAGAARAAGADVSTHTAGECGGAQTVLTQRRCATARVSSGARGTRAHAPTPELGVQQIFLRPRPKGRRAGSARPRLRALSIIARRGGRGGHAVAVPTRRSSSLDRGQDTELSSGLRTLTCSGVSQQQQQPIYRVTQAHISRSTRSDECYSADELACSAIVGIATALRAEYQGTLTK